MSRDPGGGKVDACASQVLAVLWDRARRDGLEGSSWPRSLWASVPQQLLDLSELWDLCTGVSQGSMHLCRAKPGHFGGCRTPVSGRSFPRTALPHGKGCRMCCHTTCGISCCWHAWGGCGHAADAIEHVLLALLWGAFPAPPVLCSPPLPLTPCAAPL